MYKLGRDELSSDSRMGNRRSVHHRLAAPSDIHREILHSGMAVQDELRGRNCKSISNESFGFSRTIFRRFRLLFDSHSGPLMHSWQDDYNATLVEKDPIKLR